MATKSDSELMEPVAISATAWRSAIKHCRQGTPVYLLNYLFHPAQTDGAGRPLRLYAFPNDQELRWEIVQALLHIGRFAGSRKPTDLMILEYIGTPRERVRDIEVAAVTARSLGATEDDLNSLAQALKIDTETIKRRARSLRRGRAG